MSVLALTILPRLIRGVLIHSDDIEPLNIVLLVVNILTSSTSTLSNSTTV